MKKKLKNKAIELRKSGISITQIASILNVSKSSVSLWVREILISEEQKIFLLKRSSTMASVKRSSDALAKRLEWQKMGASIARKLDPSFIAGCMLYWGEGSKGRNSLQICNSDCNLLKVFLDFLQKHFNISSKEVIWKVNCRLDCGFSIEEVEEYWKKSLNLLSQNKRKVTIKSEYYPKKQNKTKLPYGICIISVHSTEIVQMVFGAIQEYGKFHCPRWSE